MYRRHFLRFGLTGTLAAMAGFATRSARAQDFPKLTHEQAQYQENAASQLCSSCALFQPPDGCKTVVSPISETATCMYFNQ
jgi:hypothetical protein